MGITLLDSNCFIEIWTIHNKATAPVDIDSNNHPETSVHKIRFDYEAININPCAPTGSWQSELKHQVEPI